MTARILDSNGIDYKIVIEPQEADEYIEAVGADKVLILPFSNLGLGSFPARNFCWDHSKSNGFMYHWVLDDNIQAWRTWLNGKRINTKDVSKAMVYVERHAQKRNIDIAGFEEPNFVVKPPSRPFKHNCHVYSLLLIKNSLPYRWRLKYNEDIDLCLQVLHTGGTTASCLIYMADKVSTSRKMKGGNQDELYKGNDPKKKLLKAKMLEAVWPQYAKTVVRFNRFHHFVDWKVFQRKPKKQA